MKIVVATHNEGKLVEIRNILNEQLSAAAQGIELVSAGSLDLADPAETGVTFEENALLKARFVAGATGLPAIADDSGLIVDVMRLPRRLREVTLLYYYHGMDERDIAEALGISRSAVSDRLSRARRKLKGMIEGRDEA